MRVRNNQDHGVFVPNYGVVPAGDEATVQDGEAVRQMIRDGVLREAKSSAAASSDSESEGDD